MLFLKGNLSPVRIFEQLQVAFWPLKPRASEKLFLIFKQLKVAFWQLKPTKFLFFKGNLALARIFLKIKQLKVAFWPLKPSKFLFLKGNLGPARKKNLVFKQLKWHFGRDVYFNGKNILGWKEG